MDLSEIVLNEQEKNGCLYQCCCLLVSVDMRQSNILDLAFLTKYESLRSIFPLGFLHLGSRILEVFIRVPKEVCSFK